MLTVNTSMVMLTVHAIEEYLTVGSFNRSVSKAVGEEIVPGKLSKPIAALTAQLERLATRSGLPTAQAETLAKMVARLEYLEESGTWKPNLGPDSPWLASCVETHRAPTLKGPNSPVERVFLIGRRRQQHPVGRLIPTGGQCFPVKILFPTGKRRQQQRQ